jgi:hypothetical protein
MTSEWMTKPELRGPMTGLISGFNILAEMLVAAKVIDPQALAGHLQTKIEEFREPLDPILSDAANVLSLFRAPLVAEDRAATRKLLNDEPKGEA